MTREEWLALPRIVRAWRVRFCRHPFEHSHYVGTIPDPTRDFEEYRFAIHVMECGRCRQFFIDAGLVPRAEL